jgi:glycosyltransferase involved in cell wall biosynthesis
MLRQERFLSIGRCAREKRWLELIEVVERLRERGHDVGLTLAGSRDHSGFEQEVAERMARAGDWVERKTDFSREELQELLVTHKYGLHGMLDEHYGMAVAELILGGCLTSVHNDGGQVEIVTNPKLRYNSLDDAVDKWDAVLSSDELFEELLEEQLARREHLKKERFVKEFEEVVRLSLERGVEGVLEGLREGTLTGLGHFSP